MEDNGINTGPGGQPFGMPGSYFDRSAEQLKNRMLWLEEHREFPALKMAWREQVFEVPENYFEKSAAGIELLPYPHLMRRGAENGWSIPENYFEEFSFFDESEVLRGVPKQLHFGVPPGYFEGSAKKLAGAEPPVSRVIPLFRRSLQFAAAAALLVVLGFWLYNHYFVAETAALDCGGIACVDKHELLQGKNLESLDDDQLYELVNSKELEKKLNNQDAPALKKDSALSEDELLDNI